MILGRGCAQTDAAIIAEYHEFLQKVGHITIPKNLVTIKASPKSMLRAIKKPVREWSDDDILELVRARKLASRYKYNVFLAFLFFRGYRQPSLYLLEELHIDLGHQWGPVVAPYREKVDQAAKELGRPKAKQVTHLLLMLLVNQGKALEQVSRADFEAFRDEYQMRYRLKRRKGQPDPRLYSLEQYLIHWGIFAPAPVVFRYEEHFSMLIHDSVRHALSFYMTWAAAKYDRSSLTGQRRALQLFFCWLQEHYPQAGSLHEVTRSIAIDYSRYLTDQAKANVYGKTYIHDLYQIVRRFFLFALDERVDEHLSHNPFMLKDISSKEAYPVPRYLSDQEIKAVLAYCEGDATLLEKVVVTLLLHTGVRVAELAMLKASDMVQIGGTWKLHIHEGKGLKDRVIPLTACCVELLQAWQNDGWERANNFLFTHYGRPSQHGASMSTLLRKIGLKVGVIGLTAHRFRHTFA